jgi:hypothetical protein
VVILGFLLVSSSYSIMLSKLVSHECPSCNHLAELQSLDRDVRLRDVVICHVSSSSVSL